MIFVSLLHKARCRVYGCDEPDDIDANPTIVKMRKLNDELDREIVRRHGRDFLENMILAREHEIGERRHVPGQ
jgi:hypothetical protein